MRTFQASPSPKNALIRFAWWLTAIVMRRNPSSASCRTITSRIGLSPSGISGFGNVTVYGRRRVPRPPASTTARSDIVEIRLVAAQVRRIAEPLRGARDPLGERHARTETGGPLQLRAVAAQPQHLARR